MGEGNSPMCQSQSQDDMMYDGDPRLYPSGKTTAIRRTAFRETVDYVDLILGPPKPPCTSQHSIVLMGLRGVLEIMGAQ